MPRPRLLIALAVTIALGACTADGGGSRPPVGSPVPAPSPRGTTVALEVEIASQLEPRRLLPRGGAAVAIPGGRDLPMWNEPGPGSPDMVFDPRNPFGQLAPLLIDDAVSRDGEVWYEVLLPVRPNGASAWVRAGDVTVRRRTQRLEVDLSARTLRWFDGAELVHRFRVGVGATVSPTGTGRFSVWVKVRYEDPLGPYGNLALGLTGFSPLMTDWPGGGRMAVHGTPNPDDRGRAVSHGCVRVVNADMELLGGLPLGTPVEIRA